MLAQHRSRAPRRPWPVALGALLAFTATTASADDTAGPDTVEPDAAEPDAGRRLGGHRFVPSALVDWGFVESWFSSTTSSGFARFDIATSSPLAAIILGPDTKVIFAGQTFSGSAAVTSWLGATLRVTVAGVIPRDEVSTIAVGAHEIYRGEAGVVLRLIRSGRFQLAARTMFRWGETRSIVPSRIPDSPYLEGDVGSIHPALTAALAISRSIGLQASASYDLSEFEFIQEDRVHTVRGGVAATFAIPKLPLTLLVSAEVAKDFDRDIRSPVSLALFGTKDVRGRFELGAYYQGRRDLDIGVAVSYQRDRDSEEQRELAHITMSYYF